MAADALVLALALLQTPAEDVYRLSRRPVSAAGPHWDWADEFIPLSQWRCNLEPAAPPAHAVRMTDPARPDRDCEWTADASAWIWWQATGMAYTYTLAVRPAGGAGWSAAVLQNTDLLISPPRGVRVTPGN